MVAPPAEHERMLEELGQGVGRLKTQSTLINDETSLHVRLLDDMEGEAATASAGLRTEARHAENVRKFPRLGRRRVCDRVSR